jgi:hypothetical protein
MRVERALEKLRGALERRGITSTAAVVATVLGGQGVAQVPAGLATQVAAQAVAGSVSAGWAAAMTWPENRRQRAGTG